MSFFKIPVKVIYFIEKYVFNLSKIGKCLSNLTICNKFNTR